MSATGVDERAAVVRVRATGIDAPTTAVDVRVAAPDVRATGLSVEDGLVDDEPHPAATTNVTTTTENAVFE